jgi:hypothetical protein
MSSETWCLEQHCPSFDKLAITGQEKVELDVSITLWASSIFVDRLPVIEGDAGVAVGRVALRQPARIEEAFYWVAPPPIGRSRG